MDAKHLPHGNPIVSLFGLLNNPFLQVVLTIMIQSSILGKWRRFVGIIAVMAVLFVCGDLVRLGEDGAEDQGKAVLICSMPRKKKGCPYFRFCLLSR